MPYDKGDFTQQGVNGDVSALVRLNEKRVMKVVLSSDDESDNCDISGAVYDLLNGESYTIGSTTPTGTITITENGTGIDVSQYALADVNVSGGGGSVGTLTVDTSEISENVTVQFPRCENIAGYPFKDSAIQIARATTSITEKVPLNSSEHVGFNLFLLYGAEDYDLVGGDNTTVYLEGGYMNLGDNTTLLRIYSLSCSTDTATVKLEMAY